MFCIRNVTDLLRSLILFDFWHLNKHTNNLSVNNVYVLIPHCIKYLYRMHASEQINVLLEGFFHSWVGALP